MVKEGVLGIIKADGLKVESLEDDASRATVIIEPLERGYGQTLGASLRRIMIASMVGTKITSVLIEGVAHELTHVSGVQEDVIDICLNLKEVVIARETYERRVVRVSISGPCVFHARDISDFSDLQIVNGDLPICTLDENASLEMQLVIESGRGYRIASSQKKAEDTMRDAIELDVRFSPVDRVSFMVGQSRLGQFTNYDKLVMQVATDGSVTPKEAIEDAVRIFQDQLSVLVFPIARESTGEATVVEGTDKVSALHEMLSKKIEELELSVRAHNCLRNESIIYLGDLVHCTETQMLHMPNFGKKSLVELKGVLAYYNLRFGMDTEGWTSSFAATHHVEKGVE